MTVSLLFFYVPVYLDRYTPTKRDISFFQSMEEFCKEDLTEEECLLTEEELGAILEELDKNSDADSKNSPNKES